MKIKSGLFLLFIIMLLFGTVSLYAQGESIVRGKLIRVDKYGTYPIPYVPVTLYDIRNRYRIGPVYTDVYGMYYFYGVVRGDYDLEIWDLGRRNDPLIRPIRVFRMPYNDIPPIRLP